MSEVIDRPAAEKRSVILNPQRIGLAEQQRQEWVVNIEEGTTLADVTDTQFWSHCATLFQQFDHIECRWETGERIVQLIVLATGRNWARVHVAQAYEFKEIGEAPAASVKHTIEWKGPQRKHVVIRIADSVAVQEGFSQKAEAALWLANHERVTAQT